MRARLVALLLASLTLAGCVEDAPKDVDSDGDGVPDDIEKAHGSDPKDPASVPILDVTGDDVVVVAVLDWQINPYHHDFQASRMPQHLNADRLDDLPLSTSPDQWLPGFPMPEAFDSYGPLLLTPPTNDTDVPADLYERDAAAWAEVPRSGNGEVHLRWVPGTKIVGFVNFGGDSDDGFAASSHGVGSASVSTGNIHGTCPSCLLVFVNIPASEGEEWVRQQSWIDASTHSYEASSTGALRDNISNCDTSTTKAAVERGQQIFWAAGNGVANTFTVPQLNLVNCEKGPDWTVTVGAIEPEDGESFTGHAKPVHVSNVGIRYPSAGGGSVTAEGSFSGTSNATPVTAGMYGEALHRLRKMVSGDARTQQGGVILQGSLPCGEANPECAFADGVLTVHELREALFRAATPTDTYFTVGTGGTSVPVGTEETEYFTEGHGSFYGRTGDWEAEIQAIVDHAAGVAVEEASAPLREYMAAYSWCSQEVWGTWDHGYYMPGMDLVMDPARPFTTWLGTVCPETVEAVLLLGN